MPAYATRVRLAEVTGVSAHYLGLIERGAAYPSGDLLERLIAVLEIGTTTAGALWEELARYQLDPVVGSHVQVTHRRPK